MIQRVLDEIQAAGGVLTLAELSRKLGMERSAVESIVEMLKRKKLLARQDGDESMVSCPACRTTRAKACSCH